MRYFAAALFVLVSLPTEAAAQNARLGEPSGQTLAPWDEVSVRAPASFGRRLLSGLGGAAIGAGVGFFASQVVHGDWEDESGDGPARPVWAAVGGSIGLAMGLSFPVPGGRAATAPPVDVPDRRRIRASELAGAGYKTAGDAIRGLRPEWLNPRGVHVIGEGRDDGIQVYLDGIRMGGVRFLGDVPVETIQEMRLIDAAEATMRWGAGNSHGAILIVVDGGEGTRSTWE